MTKQIKKKKISVREYFKRSLLMSVLYFIALITWNAIVFDYNKSQADSPIWLLILFLLVFIIWFFCYFEIRTVTLNDERFLGYKSYILFFLKLCYMPVIVLCTFIIGLLTDSVAYLMITVCGVVTIYYIAFAIMMYPYKLFIRNNGGELYISYQIRVKKWYKEGGVI